MKIFLGADHRGFALKEKVFDYLKKHNYDVVDIGDKIEDPNDDFPEFAHAAAGRVLESTDEDPRAILICGGGQGMAIAANRFRGIRAVVIWNAFEARESRNDNDSNVLALPARVLEDNELAWQSIIETWLHTPFSRAVRYKRRNAQIDEM